MITWLEEDPNGRLGTRLLHLSQQRVKTVGSKIEQGHELRTLGKNFPELQSTLCPDQQPAMCDLRPAAPGDKSFHSSRQTNPCLEGYTFNLSDQDGYLPLNHRILSDLIMSHKTEWVSAVTNRVATFMLQLFLSTLMWYAELCPPVMHRLESSLSAPQNGTVFGKGVTTHVVS